MGSTLERYSSLFSFHAATTPTMLEVVRCCRQIVLVLPPSGGTAFEENKEIRWHPQRFDLCITRMRVCHAVRRSPGLASPPWTDELNPLQDIVFAVGYSVSRMPAASLQGAWVYMVQSLLLALTPVCVRVVDSQNHVALSIVFSSNGHSSLVIRYGTT